MGFIENIQLGSLALGLAIGVIGMALFWMLDRGKFEKILNDTKAQVENLRQEADEALDALVDAYDALDEETRHSEALQVELFDAVAPAKKGTRKAAGTTTTKAIEPTTRKRSSK